jgi:hypothetical protein
MSLFNANGPAASFEIIACVEFAGPGSCLRAWFLSRIHRHGSLALNSSALFVVFEFIGLAFCLRIHRLCSLSSNSSALLLVFEFIGFAPCL